MSYALMFMNVYYSIQKYNNVGYFYKYISRNKILPHYLSIFRRF